MARLRYSKHGSDPVRLIAFHPDDRSQQSPRKEKCLGWMTWVHCVLDDTDAALQLSAYHEEKDGKLSQHKSAAEDAGCAQPTPDAEAGDDESDLPSDWEEDGMIVVKQEPSSPSA